MENIPSNDLGGLNINPATNTGSDTGNTNNSPSAEIIKQRRTRSDAGKSRGVRSGNTPQGIVTISPEQFKTLYSPKLWAKVLAAPADGMLSITGSKTWDVSESEREMLGETGSVAAQCFAVSDPRWLAVSLALIAIIDVYGMRIAKDYAEKKLKEKAARDNIHSIK